MPLYEYQCEKCGDVFEVRQKFTDEPLTTHEACGGAVQRLLSAPALQFKGSGWYVNDYAKGSSGGGNNSNSSKSESSSSGESKSAGSKENSSSGSKSEATTSKASTTSTDSKSS